MRLVWWPMGNVNTADVAKANDHGAQRHVLRCGHLDRHRRNHGDDGDVGDQVAENSTNQVDGEEAAEVAKRSKHFDQGFACPHIQAH
eukprot:CAMPEP_0177552928 /NCGR_PEP_ID=MMETSP0369-20130122/67125_1 /TAXON_ID=447022 ORGANISM="Scrippsiella hangoei-like, Strain SHHI-4" /NCGR_SAMPLE_ID=MMETSP0369 /ASSEMBLY_ACC=CAM_ASM_000364 /LENGTH=86 /DNA_ID=CAMNT_0019038745 /DNA_START=367 /DNA_END=627 /DNA_ORIENTATION=-